MQALSSVGEARLRVAEDRQDALTEELRVEELEDADVRAAREVGAHLRVSLPGGGEPSRPSIDVVLAVPQKGGPKRGIPLESLLGDFK